MNGIGSDAFALIWDGERAARPERFGPCAARRGRPSVSPGRDRMPIMGWDTRHGSRRGVSVGGFVAAVRQACRSLSCSLPPSSMRSAGFSSRPTVARQWADAGDRVAGQPGFAAAFLPGGRAPRAGELFRHPGAGAHAAGNRRNARRVVLSRRARREDRGGQPRAGRRDDGRGSGGPPARLGRAGQPRTTAALRLHEIPPNGQGIAALMALGILEHFDLPALAPWIRADSVHLQIEAMKLAFADAVPARGRSDVDAGVRCGAARPRHICAARQAHRPPACTGLRPRRAAALGHGVSDRRRRRAA